MEGHANKVVELPDELVPFENHGIPVPLTVEQRTRDPVLRARVPVQRRLLPTPAAQRTRERPGRHNHRWPQLKRSNHLPPQSW